MLAVAVEEVIRARAVQSLAHRPDVRLDDALAEFTAERQVELREGQRDCPETCGDFRSGRAGGQGGRRGEAGVVDKARLARCAPTVDDRRR